VGVAAGQRLAAALLVGCCALSSLSPLNSVALGAGAQPLPNGPGKEAFESVCSLCHDAPAAVMGKQWTRAQWDAKVAEMLQEETDVTSQERAAIVEYLAANFKPGGKIYINRATAKDLETLLELSARDAEAVARYRAEHGLFKTVADLENAIQSVTGNGGEVADVGDVADVASRAARAATIAAKKDRLEF
jgi:hypothetical protein